jgi:hypothetical protein
MHSPLTGAVQNRCRRATQDPMSIDLQIRSSVLATITTRAVQHHLRATCFDPIDSIHIDHADVAATPDGSRQ